MSVVSFVFSFFNPQSNTAAIFYFVEPIFVSLGLDFKVIHSSNSNIFSHQNSKNDNIWNVVYDDCIIQLYLH